MSRHVILGGGITGIATGYFLSTHSEQVTVVEKQPSIGGLASSSTFQEFTLDVGPHKLYSVIPGIMGIMRDVLGEDCLVINKKNSLYLFGKNFSFPIKPLQFAKDFPKTTALKCGISWLHALITQFLSKKQITSYEDYFLAGFGSEAYNVLFEGLCWKVWGDPKTITAELARRRVPVPSIGSLLKNTFSKKQKPEVSADQFYYPKGGVGLMCEKFSERLKKNKGEVLCGSIPVKIHLEGKTIKSTMLKTPQGEELIMNPKSITNTLHLDTFLSLFDPAPPKPVLDAAAALTYRSLILVYVFINKPRVLDDHWIFFPEKKFVFNRVSEQKNFSPHIAPHDKTFIVAEVSCAQNAPYWKLSQEAIVEVVIKDLEKAKLIKKQEVIAHHIVKIERMYPVYDLNYQKNVRTILNWIHSIENLYTIGRQGLFAYTNTDHSIDMAQKLANHITWSKSRESWEECIEYFDSYRIVD